MSFKETVDVRRENVIVRRVICDGKEDSLQIALLNSDGSLAIMLDYEDVELINSTIYEAFQEGK